MTSSVMRKILGRKGMIIRKGRLSVSVDGALMNRRGHAYVRVLPSIRVGKGYITGKASIGSRGREVGIYGRRPPISGGASYNRETHRVSPSLRYKMKKIF